jgi:hypothetical protein
MSGRRSRTKGHGFERKIAQLFREFFPTARRKLEYQSCDIDGTDLEGTGRLRIQCKKYKSYAPINKIKEVQFKEGGMPALITAGDREDAIICIKLDDFFDILRNPDTLYID